MHCVREREREREVDAFSLQELVGIEVGGGREGGSEGGERWQQG